MKELLIIRSVSFQQLDLNLPEIMKRFPGYRISILTHEHGVELAKKYKEISHIYVYPYTESFHKKHKVPALKNKVFDAVIIPVTNITGVGFLNVLAYGLNIRSREYYMCNVVSDISQVSIGMIHSKRAHGALYQGISWAVTLLLSVVMIPVVCIGLKRCLKH